MADFKVIIVGGGTGGLTLAEARLEKILLSDTAKVRFGDIWKKRHVYALLNLEEGNLETWTGGSIICIGDIVHKVYHIMILRP